jgi:1,4-dihydroxy-2-naphthoate octaprenyltransferase
MTTTIIIWSNILIYVISLFTCRSILKFLYTKGPWKSISPGFGDIIITCFPVFNTMGALILSVVFFHEKFKYHIDYNKFFNIK